MQSASSSSVSGVWTGVPGWRSTRSLPAPTPQVGGLLACPEDGVIKVFDEGEEIVDLELLDLEHDIRVTCKGRYLKILRNTLTCISAGLVQRKVPEKTTAIPNNIVKQSSDVDKENNLEVNLRNKDTLFPRRDKKDLR